MHKWLNCKCGKHEKVELLRGKTDDFMGMDFDFREPRLHVSNRGRPDTQLTVTMSCTRAQNPNKSDWDKPAMLLKFLNGTKNKKLRITANGLAVAMWHVDASFAPHADCKSCPGASYDFDGGMGHVMNPSRKQKLNTRSSTESELVGVDDGLNFFGKTCMCWQKNVCLTPTEDREQEGETEP